jgi:uncharacterized protein (DUF608 family)
MNAGTGRRWLDAGATAAAFPLGGVGTGNVSIGSRGEFRDWELCNRPNKGATLPFSFFAVRAQPDEAEPVTRVLESRITGPHEADQGYDAGRVAGLPRLARSRMTGEYPLLEIAFEDDDLPVNVALTAFTPFVPLDAAESGIPAAIIRYRVHNPLSTRIHVTVAGSLANPVGISGYNVFHFPEYDGMPANAGYDDGVLRGIRFSSDLPADHLESGTATLATPDTNVSMKPQWLSGFWQDGVQVFWDDLCDDGRLHAEERFSIDEPPYPDWFTRLRVGSLAVEHTLAAGETRDFEFLLGWHFPNRPRAWQGNINLDNTHADEVVRNHYAARFTDAWAAVRYVADNLDVLEGATRAFHDALFNSTLPAEVVDAVSSTLVVARSTTCFRLEDGTFAAWEGSFDHAGSCEGTCTHVWNYAQTLAQLFPELERSARRTEFLCETREDGRMNFRANSVFGNEPWDFHPAVDGQLGAIVRLYREWQYSGDQAFINELWPHARRALDYAFSQWDSNGDFVLDSQQHNTYDIEFYGENSLANSMFFAALAAGAAIAEHLGDAETALRYRSAADAGSARMDELLFNGEYYEQKLDDVDAKRYQYGRGCLSDQLFGQTLAHVAGLGHVLPEPHVKSAILAVFTHNFRRDLTRHNSVQRTYALNNESGLVLCSWPNGGRPRIPFVYSDEEWSGIEYQVATHLIYEGFAHEGLEIVRATRERYDGVKRNPWNEVECGNHYARSMASWGVLLALTGVRWSAPNGTLHLRPSTAVFDAAGEADFFVSTGSAWGSAHFDASGARLTLLAGDLSLSELTAEHPQLGRLTASGPTTIHAGQSITLAAAPFTEEHEE